MKNCYICKERKASSNNYCRDCYWRIISHYNINHNEFKKLFFKYTRSVSRKYLNDNIFDEITKTYDEIMLLFHKYNDIILTTKTRRNEIEEMKNNFKFCEDLKLNKN